MTIQCKQNLTYTPCTDCSLCCWSQIFIQLPPYKNNSKAFCTIKMHIVKLKKIVLMHYNTQVTAKKQLCFSASWVVNTVFNFISVFSYYHLQKIMAKSLPW